MTNDQVAENKGQDAQRSDNGVYGKCGYSCNELWREIDCPVHSTDDLRRQWDDAATGNIALPHIAGFRIYNPQASPISLSQPNQTPANSIVREDEK